MLPALVMMQGKARVVAARARRNVQPNPKWDTGSFVLRALRKHDRFLLTARSQVREQRHRKQDEGKNTSGQQPDSPVHRHFPPPSNDRASIARSTENASLRGGTMNPPS